MSIDGDAGGAHMTVATHPFHTQLTSHSSLSLHAMQMRCMPVDASSSLSLASSSSSVAGMLSSFFHCCCTHNFTHFADIFHHYIDHYVLIIPTSPHLTLIKANVLLARVLLLMLLLCLPRLVNSLVTMTTK